MLSSPCGALHGLLKTPRDGLQGGVKPPHSKARLRRAFGRGLIRYSAQQITGGAEMKSHTEYLWFNTKKRREFINITGELERALEKARIQEGLVLASAMHITAGVYINDAEDGLIADITEWLEKLAPFREDYRHHRTGEDNGDAHLKNLLIGHQVLVPVTNGKLDLGPWQQVYYAEFDGQRRKRVLIKVLGE
jgi:secondary thiamine-phosphate synthase enzyme